MEFNKIKVILFTTDTLHHKYFAKVIEDNNKIELFIVYEKKKIKPKFKVGEIDSLKQIKFEKKKFFENRKIKLKSKIFEVNTVNSKRCINFIKNVKAQVGISFGTGFISTQVINLFKKKIINVHRGDMTKYRGLDSEFWACYHQDFKSIGTTIHFVNKYFDKGKTIFQDKIKINKYLRAYKLRYYTTVIASKNILKIILKVNKLKLKNFKENKIHGRYYSFIPFELKKIAYNNLNRYCQGL